MGFLIIVALFFPRLIYLYLWIFTLWFRVSFDTWFWPWLGFLVLPFTTVWYGYHEFLYQGWNGWHYLVLLLAVLLDLASNGSPLLKRENRPS